MLIENIPPEQIGCVFDIRHAAVEAGEAWPVYFDLMKPHITAASFKDFRWNGRKSEHVPLGQGLVDPKFFQMLEASDFSGPISVHVEYLPKGDAKENLAAITRDFATFRQMLKALDVAALKSVEAPVCRFRRTTPRTIAANGLPSLPLFWVGCSMGSKLGCFRSLGPMRSTICSDLRTSPIPYLEASGLASLCRSS